MTDLFTKFSIAVPTRNQEATTVASVLIKEWVFRYGVLPRVHNEQVRNFQFDVM